jgi:hypothetical protein
MCQSGYCKKETNFQPLTGIEQQLLGFLVRTGSQVATQTEIFRLFSLVMLYPKLLIYLILLRSKNICNNFIFRLLHMFFLQSKHRLIL